MYQHFSPPYSWASNNKKEADKVFLNNSTKLLAKSPALYKRIIHHDNVRYSGNARLVQHTKISQCNKSHLHNKGQNSHDQINRCCKSLWQNETLSW